MKFFISCLGLLLAVLPAGENAQAQSNNLMQADLVEEVEVKQSAPDNQSALEARVNARWDAMKSGDYKAVYSYSSPEYRKLNTYGSFEANMGSSVEWLSIDVQKVDIDNDRARVYIKLVYRLALPGMAGERFGSEMGEIETTDHENWVRRSGQWWYVAPEGKGL